MSTRTISIRLTETQAARLQEICERRQLTAAEFLRDVIGTEAVLEKRETATVDNDAVQQAGHQAALEVLTILERTNAQPEHLMTFVAWLEKSGQEANALLEQLTTITELPTLTAQRDELVVEVAAALRDSRDAMTQVTTRALAEIENVGNAALQGVQRLLERIQAEVVAHSELVRWTEQHRTELTLARVLVQMTDPVLTTRARVPVEAVQVVVRYLMGWMEGKTGVHVAEGSSTDTPGWQHLVNTLSFLDSWRSLKVLDEELSRLATWDKEASPVS
jgi:predicted DNA-binding protein